MSKGAQRRERRYGYHGTKVADAQWCEGCRKFGFPTRRDAKKHLEQQRATASGSRIKRAYRADCGWWHLTSMAQPPADA